MDVAVDSQRAREFFRHSLPRQREKALTTTRGEPPPNVTGSAKGKYESGVETLPEWELAAYGQILHPTSTTLAATPWPNAAGQGENATAATAVTPTLTGPAGADSPTSSPPIGIAFPLASTFPPAPVTSSSSTFIATTPASAPVTTAPVATTTATTTTTTAPTATATATTIPLSSPEPQLRQGQGFQCHIRACDQLVVGRDLSYARALEIVQNEQYLEAADLDLVRIKRRWKRMTSSSHSNTTSTTTTVSFCFHPTFE